jgi:hypothetical protein
MKKTATITFIVIASLAALFIGRQAESNAAQNRTDLTVQKTALDSLIEMYAQRKIDSAKVEEAPVDILESEDVIKLRSELIDIRVERDRLMSRNKQLQEQIQQIKTNTGSKCSIENCVPQEEVELEKIRMEIVHWVHMHNMMNYIKNNCENDVYICNQAQEWAEGAARHLRVMGINVLEGEEIDLDRALTELEAVKSGRP